MEKLVLYVKKETQKSGHSLLQVSPEMHAEVKALATQLNMLPINVANELISFALANVEIREEKGE